MELEGYAVKRIDNGQYWNKIDGWCQFPTIYQQKRYATCAGTAHTKKENRVAVKVRVIIDEVEE